MDQGEILQLGTPSEVYERPTSTTVAQFIGSPAINLLPARVDAAVVSSFSGEPLPIEVRRRPVQALTIGVRPEAMRIGSRALRARRAGSGGVRISARKASCISISRPRHRSRFSAGSATTRTALRRARQRSRSSRATATFSTTRDAGLRRGRRPSFRRNRTAATFGVQGKPHEPAAPHPPAPYLRRGARRQQWIEAARRLGFATPAFSCFCSPTSRRSRRSRS